MGLVDRFAFFARWVDVDFAAYFFELGAHVGHAAFGFFFGLRVVAHVLRDFHAAEFWAAHAAEVCGFVCVFGEGFVVVGAGGVGV